MKKEGKVKGRIDFFVLCQGNLEDKEEVGGYFDWLLQSRDCREDDIKYEISNGSISKKSFLNL